MELAGRGNPRQWGTTTAGSGVAVAHKRHKAQVIKNQSEREKVHRNYGRCAAVGNWAGKV